MLQQQVPESVSLDIVMSNDIDKPDILPQLPQELCGGRRWVKDALPLAPDVKGFRLPGFE